MPPKVQALISIIDLVETMLSKWQTEEKELEYVDQMLEL